MKRLRNEKASVLEKSNKRKLKQLLQEYDSPGCTPKRKKELQKIFKKAQTLSDSILLSLEKGKDNGSA